LPASLRNKSFKRLGNQKFEVHLKDYDVFPQVCMDVVKSSSLILCEKCLHKCSVIKIITQAHWSTHNLALTMDCSNLWSWKRCYRSTHVSFHTV